MIYLFFKEQWICLSSNTTLKDYKTLIKINSPNLLTVNKKNQVKVHKIGKSNKSKELLRKKKEKDLKQLENRKVFIFLSLSERLKNKDRELNLKVLVTGMVSLLREKCLLNFIKKLCKDLEVIKKKLLTISKT